MNKLDFKSSITQSSSHIYPILSIQTLYILTWNMQPLSKHLNHSSTLNNPATGKLMEKLPISNVHDGPKAPSSQQQRQHVKTEWKCLRMAFDIPVCWENEKDMLYVEYYLGAEQSEPFSRDQSMQPACLTIFSRSIFPSRLIWQSQVCSVRVWKKSQMLEFRKKFCDVKKSVTAMRACYWPSRDPSCWRVCCENRLESAEKKIQKRKVG